MSFTAAKAMRLDILKALRDEVDLAIANGGTLREFVTNLEPELTRLGWWGKTEVLDQSTGEVRTIDVNPRRLETIFDTNLRTSYARGRWERIERVRERFPWLRYVAVMDGRTRPEHAAWHNTVLPVDHPFWRTHFPPTGWRCRCTVAQLSDEDLETYGFMPTSAPKNWQETRPWVNRYNDPEGKRIIQVPVGIDPGFQHNVGMLPTGRETMNRLVEKIDRAPADMARASIGRFWNGPHFRRHLTGASDGDWPVAIVRPEVLGAIGGRSHTLRFTGETAAKQAGVRLSPDGKHARGHPDVQPADYGLVQQILDEGEWFEARQSERHASGFLEIDGKLWRTVIKASEDEDKTFMQTLHRARNRDLTSARRKLKWIVQGGE